MSHSTSRMASTSTTAAPSSAAIAWRRAGSTSQMVRRAPAWCSSRARCAPTWPTPWTATCRPFRSGLPKTWLAMASMPRRQPSAVNGDGSPEPPLSIEVPRTCLVVGAHDVHVGRRRARVLGRDVAAAEVIDEAAEGAEQRGALVGGPLGEIGGRHDDGLAAAVRQVARSPPCRPCPAPDGSRRRWRRLRSRRSGCACRRWPGPSRVEWMPTSARRPEGASMSEVQLAVAEVRERVEKVHEGLLQRRRGYNDERARRQRKCV